MSTSACDISNVTPHCLWHLSSIEWKHMKNFAIHATDLFLGEITTFSHVTLGANVVAPLKKTTSHGNTIIWKELNLSVMTGGFVYITTTTRDIQSMVDANSVILIDSTNGCSCNQNQKDNSNLSGIVLLAAIHLNKYRKRNGNFWGKQHFDIAYSCKNNILTESTSHHQSSGYYYSWGNRANYRTVDLSSVTQYTHIKKKGIVAEINASFLEESMNIELKNSILTMKNKFPFLATVISPIVGVAFKMQTQHGNINIEKTGASEVGIWESTLSINAVTKELHTEDDVTYTVIDVPLQMKRKENIKYHFLFQFSKKFNISVPMITGTTIIFSGKLLTHRQSCNVFNTTDDDLFFNFGSYGNKKLYNHIKQSFLRHNAVNNFNK